MIIEKKFKAGLTKDIFNEEELNKIISYGNKLVVNEAKLVDVKELDYSVRKTDVSWINVNQQTDWIFKKFNQLGKDFCSFIHPVPVDYIESLQYTVYKPGFFYRWHKDRDETSNIKRSLTIVLQLSDPSEYEGGDLQIDLEGNCGTGNKFEVDVMPKHKGAILIFPAGCYHQVTPVTNGIRKTLVSWFNER